MHFLPSTPLGLRVSFKKEKARQFKYDRNQRVIKERKLINFQRRSIEKMYLKSHSQSKEDYGITGAKREKVSHYFGDDNAVKILRMDSMNSSKETSFKQRVNSRNSNVRKNGAIVNNTIHNSLSGMGERSNQVFMNQTPIIVERANLSVDDNLQLKFSKSKGMFYTTAFLIKWNFTLKILRTILRFT